MCECKTWGSSTNRFSCGLRYAGVVETRFHTAGTPELYEVGWTRSDEEPARTVGLRTCYGATSRACADAFLNAHPRGAAEQCYYDPGSLKEARRGHHVVTFERG